MSKETKMILQSIIDSINHPAFVEQNNKIILSNQSFTKKFNDSFNKESYQIFEKSINDHTKICEIKEDQIAIIERQRKQLALAMEKL